MKRTITVLVAAAALVGLAGCGNPITHRGTCPGSTASCVRW